MSEFDFYKAQNKIEKLRADEDRWLRKLLAAGRRVEAARARRVSLERRVAKEQERTVPKTCGAVRPRIANEDTTAPCPLAVGHAGKHRDGALTWGGGEKCGADEIFGPDDQVANLIQGRGR